MVSLLLPCATPMVVPERGMVLAQCHPRGSAVDAALTLPHVRYRLRVRRMAVLCTFNMPSMYRHVHRQFMRNELRNFTTIVPITVCQQGSYVETYSRYSVCVAEARCVSRMVPLPHCSEYLHART